MDTTTLQILDEVNCRFVGLTPEIRRHLYNSSKVFNPSNRFIPSVRLGRWDGKVAYFAMNGDTYINLLEPIIEFLDDKGWTIDIDDQRTYNRHFEFVPITKESYSHILWPKGHPFEGKPVVLRDHQVEATNLFLTETQGIACLPTASGKSLITAILSHKVEKYGRSIVIVPNKDLIGQTEAYYKLLGLDVGVYYGDRKDFFRTHTICTWQSLEKLKQKPIDVGHGDPVTLQEFVEDVVAIIVDECHGIKAEKLSGLLTKDFGTSPIRWAVTGTVPKEPHEIINLTIAIGSVVHTLATSDLQEVGVLSDCEVKIKQLIDTREFKTYAAEYDYLVTNPDRLDIIADLIKDAAKTGNVLVLVGRKETGKKLEARISGSVFLSGATKSSTRKEHYNEVSTTNNKVIIATAGIAAVGIDIPRLHHLFMIEPGKSFVRTIQSVGRALRTSFDKVHATIWDICSTCRFSKRHLTARKKYYGDQEFPYDIEKITWE